MEQHKEKIAAKSYSNFVVCSLVTFVLNIFLNLTPTAKNHFS